MAQNIKWKYKFSPHAQENAASEESQSHGNGISADNHSKVRIRLLTLERLSEFRAPYGDTESSKLMNIRILGVNRIEWERWENDDALLGWCSMIWNRDLICAPLIKAKRPRTNTHLSGMFLISKSCWEYLSRNDIRAAFLTIFPLRLGLPFSLVWLHLLPSSFWEVTYSPVMPPLFWLIHWGESRQH